MITKENLQNAVNSYVDDVFNTFEFNMANAMKKIGVKFLVSTKFDMVDMFLNEQGMLDVSKLEAIALPEVEKLGKIDLAGIKFNLDDARDLFRKIKEYDNGQEM